MTEANLTEANLNQANLSRSDLTEACLAKVNLVDANLTQTNLTQADLSQADLTEANLTQANLVQTQAWTANFNRTKLTGVCLENFQINRQTSFERVICKYLYLEYYQKQRIPHDSRQTISFSQFKSTIQDLIGLVEVEFNAALDWLVFLHAFEKLQQKYKSQTIEIRSVEIKLDHQFLVKIKVAPGLEIEAIKQYFKHKYDLLSLAKNKLNTQIKADEQLSYRKHN